MILYSVNCIGDVTNNEWSIVTIHKSKEGAEIALDRYRSNWDDNDEDVPEYMIVEIDTDKESDIIYDYDKIS